MDDVIETDEAVEATEEAPEQEAPDMSEAVADLSRKFDNFASQQQQAKPSALDLLGFDENEFEDDDDDEEEEVQYQQPGADPRLDAALAEVQTLREWAIGQETKKATDGLKSLDKKYDDFSEMVPQIRALADELGFDTTHRANPRAMETLYLAIKAQADADADQAPAEEARRPGATLETGASSTAPSGGEESPEAQLAQELQKLNGARDVLD